MSSLPDAQLAPPQTIPLSELIAALSNALDMTEGQPEGTAYVAVG